MTAANTEVHHLSSGLTVWQRYDSSVKADLFSTSVTTAAGIFLIDPIFQPDSNGAPVCGVVVTNANHFRAAASFADALSVPIYASADAQTPAAVPIADGEQLAPDLRVITIEGGSSGEIALYWEGEGGALIIGDALINFGSHGFSLLPAKYCSNQKLMRKSLRRLLQFSFTRMLFAHGAPIVTSAHARLTSLVDGT